MAPRRADFFRDVWRAAIRASKTKPEPDFDTRYRDRWQRKKRHATRRACELTTSKRQILYNGHTLDSGRARFDSQLGRPRRAPHLRVPCD